MGVSNGTTALGIAVALGEIKMPKAEEICKNLDLYSSVASCSSGVELTQAQIVLLGNRPGAGGRYRIGHAVMRTRSTSTASTTPSATPASNCRSARAPRT